MKDLLSILSDPESGDLSSAWMRCEVAQAELAVALKQPMPDDRAEREEWRAGLQRLVQLNALCKSATQEVQVDLSRALEGTRRNSQQVKAYTGQQGSTGDSCDYHG